ncbi:MAG TPA: hypothetical protein PKD85_06680 [Saprospiraceae bacterium]|nr:hypothetical protein [Saprospiraceae bacterium]
MNKYVDLYLLDIINEDGDSPFMTAIDGLSEEELKKLVKVSRHFFHNASIYIKKEMLYKLPFQTDKTGYGKYCGRCNAKSRAYEGGKCCCNVFLKDLKDRRKIIESAYLARLIVEDNLSVKEDVISLMKGLKIM